MRGIREANNHTKHSGGWWKYAPTGGDYRRLTGGGVSDQSDLKCAQEAR